MITISANGVEGFLIRCSDGRYRFRVYKADFDFTDYDLEDKAIAKKRIAKLMNEDHLDEDGYPTEAALEIVRIWHWSDSPSWFEFIKSIWHLASWGWRESEADHEYKKDEKVYVYNISTAGWSGNESIIREMQENSMMWHLNWVQSRRGGHYIFELREFKDE